MRYYYDLYEIEYEYLSVRKNNGEFELVDFEDGKESIIDLINICDDIKLNKIGEKITKWDRPLSWSWYNKKYNKGETEYFDVLKRNVTNFFRNKCNAKSKEVLWTVYLGNIEEKDANGKKTREDRWRLSIQNSGYQSKRCFAPVTARATNDYSDRKYLAYIVNRYMNPVLEKFFKKKGVRLNNEVYALSEMLQWIFRSAIRNDEEINIYVPSRRMRKLLQNWIDN